MDTVALKTFVAVAESGSFSRAAEQLFMTQPAISKRIAALEEDLDVALFDRLGRQVELTEAGRTLLGSAHRILADIATSRETVRSLAEGVGGRLQLGTSHHVGIHRLPPVLKRYLQHYPGVELDLLFMDSEQAVERVQAGSLELALVTLPEDARPPLSTRVVWPDPLQIVCAPDHPLAQRKRVPVSALSTHPAVLPGRGTITRRILLDSLQPYDVPIHIALETNYLETIKMMVSVGLGWSVLPQSMVDASLYTVPVTGLTMQRDLGTVQLQGRTMSRAAQALIDLLASGSH